ncbi:putative MOFRL family protein [Candidatus Nitrosotenuis uzonensis]|uniref:Putative MOFRL family protein n=1 Tax=Candidatus Nitrosotenuis uzonensis TaxID=1407055 RepID=A0A812F188_9ARCH|nr:putative MOFRL family protein [Candidatus Nitrosotenuis uzonensis]
MYVTADLKFVLNTQCFVIKNKIRICDNKTSDALEIIDAGLVAAQPKYFLGKFIKKNKLLVRSKTIPLSKFRRIYLVSVGKAADSMTEFACTKINFDGGITIIPKNYKVKHIGKNIDIIHASHPIPDHCSVMAATFVIKLLQSLNPDDFVVFLISGGTSSLLALPWGVDLNQKKKTTEILLKSGASIHEVNAVRKHISAIKGGQILQHLKCQAVSYVMSDVVGDDLNVIASGLTYCDNSTYADCLKIVTKYRLKKRFPPSVIRHLNAGMKGLLPETPKRPKIPNIIVATNADCLEAMAYKAKLLGYDTKILHSIHGPVNITAKKIIETFSFKKKSCLVFGGEPTVFVHGAGKGGRNQELVLRIAGNIKDNVVIASVGTDGIDGNTKHAGAVFSSASKNHIATYLKNNDSNSFFRKYGGLILTGPTHTNLMDIGLILSE